MAKQSGMERNAAGVIRRKPSSNGNKGARTARRISNWKAQLLVYLCLLAAMVILVAENHTPEFSAVVFNVRGVGVLVWPLIAAACACMALTWCAVRWGWQNAWLYGAQALSLLLTFAYGSMLATLPYNAPLDLRGAALCAACLLLGVAVLTGGKQKNGRQALLCVAAAAARAIVVSVAGYAILYGGAYLAGQWFAFDPAFLYYDVEIFSALLALVIFMRRVPHAPEEYTAPPLMEKTLRVAAVALGIVSALANVFALAQLFGAVRSSGVAAGLLALLLAGCWLYMLLAGHGAAYAKRYCALFPALALLPFAVCAMGLVERTSQHGWSEPRFLGAVCLAFVLFFLITRFARKLQTPGIVALVMSAVLFAGAALGMTITLASQQGQLKTALSRNGMWEDGTVRPGGMDVSMDERYEIFSTLDYLGQTYGFTYVSALPDGFTLNDAELYFGFPYMGDEPIEGDTSMLLRAAPSPKALEGGGVMLPHIEAEIDFSVEYDGVTYAYTAQDHTLAITRGAQQLYRGGLLDFAKRAAETAVSATDAINVPEEKMSVSDEVTGCSIVYQFDWIDVRRMENGELQVEFFRVRPIVTIG